jgi:multicomponent Na+:H+ antiporter subunit E
LKVNKFLFTSIVLFIFWLAYTSSLQPEEVLTGLIASLVIAFFTYDIFTDRGFSNNIFKTTAILLAYIPVFLWEMIKANIDVAKRVINPALPINPGIVAMKTKLKADAGKMFLANSITLTPGTLTVDIIDDTLYIHWIDVKTKDPAQQQNIIVDKFERFLKGVF